MREGKTHPGFPYTSGLFRQLPPKGMLAGDNVAGLLTCMKLLGHPLRLNIILMLLKRDH